MQRTLKANRPTDPVHQAAASSPGRWKTLRLPLQIGLLTASLALALFALPQSPWYPGKLENRVARMKRQLSKTGKLSEARLFGLPDALPSPREERPASPGDDAELSKLLGDLAAAEGSASSLHDRALFQLLLGHPRAACEDLEKAAALSPESVELLNDLAAAQIARAEAEDDPRLLVQARQRIERARRIAPEDPRVLFNRALLLDLLCLVGPARRAWESYLAAGETSAWQAQAEEHRAALQVDPAAGLGKNVPAALERAAAAGDWPRVRRIAEQFPFEARSHAEGELSGEPSLLGNWAAAVKAGAASRAKRALDLLRELARVRQEKGDFLLAETVTAIEAAQAAGPADPRQEAIIEGHLAYQRALAVMSSANCEIGATELERAENHLATAGSPFRLWAKVQQAFCLYHHEEHARALDLLKQLAGEPGIDRYPSLRARTLWLSGLSHGFQRAVALSREEFGEARRLYEKLGETHLVIEVGSVLIATLDEAGDELAAWRQGVRVLRAAARSGDDAARIRVFQSLAHFARKDRDALAALLFLNEAIELGERRGPLWVQGSLRMRGEVWADLQMMDLAARDRSRAAALVKRLEDPKLRQPIESDLLELEARLIDPGQAVRQLSRILDLDEEALYPYRRIRALEGRARAHRAAGNDALAAADLEALLPLVESQELPEDHLFRQVLVDRGRDLYEELIRLDLDRRGRPDLAFEAAERWRVHRFEVAKASPRSPGPPPSLREVQNGLGSGEAVLAFLSLPDRLVAWWVTASQLEPVAVKLDSRELNTTVERFRGQVAIASAQELRVESRAVSTLLLGGLAEHLPEARHLLIVPDGPLWRLPFAALVNPATGRFLVEERSLSILPFTSSGRRSRRAGFDDRTPTLVVGNPAFDPEEFLTLEPLPYAERDVQEVARLFPRGKTLVGRSATKAALLAEIQNAELFHFSGHTLGDSSDPWGSRLVLGPGTTREEGTWTAREILAGSLSRLRLAVLASCRTGLGSRNDSEGSASLARAFLAAGAEQVVASLWNVEDREAASLLQDFYLALERGKSPPRALQDAQVRALHRGERIWAQFEMFGGGR